MAKSWRPQWPSEEKLQILDEARNTGQTVSEVCRRHQVAMGQFYAWEKQARQGALTALHNGKRGRKPAKSEADLQAQITRRGLLLPSSAWRRWRSEKDVGHNHPAPLHRGREGDNLAKRGQGECTEWRSGARTPAAIRPPTRDELYVGYAPRRGPWRSSKPTSKQQSLLRSCLNRFAVTSAQLRVPLGSEPSAPCLWSETRSR